MENQDKILNQLNNQLRSAYRKYKSFVYYDSYSGIQRLELANFERNPMIFNEEYDFDEFFRELAKIIIDEKKFDVLTDIICYDIDVIALPKRIAHEEKTKKVITNFHIENFNMDRLHYFIELPIIGQILGVLWILRCGYLLDDKLYKNCFGNRLNKHLLAKLKNKKDDYYVHNYCSDFSPFLFIPYYKKYQSWRDNGVDSVSHLLDDNKNAIMISLDLKEYFYRSLIDFKALNKDITDTRNYINEKYSYVEDEIDVIIDEYLTKFIEKVFKTYSKMFNRKYLNKSLQNKEIDINKYPMIPVGFTPSLIISNWNLQGFDQAIVENVRPEYYGRYVDDIIIVLGSHEKSESYGLQQIEQDSFDELIERYLTDKKPPKTHIFKKEEWDGEKIYRIYNQSFKNSKNHKITYRYEGLEIQDSKLKTYFFSHRHSSALLENFKDEINKNSEDFGLMHDLESIKQDFRSNLYKIDYKESINKVRDINKVEINKFEISKYMSRINWNSSDVLDNIDDDVINDMIDAFKGKIFDYLTIWDRLFTLLLINHKYKQLEDLITYIQRSIGNITFSPIEGNSYECFVRNQKDIVVVKNSLMRYLFKILSRVFSLRYNSKVKMIIDNIKYDFVFEDVVDFPKQISNCLYASMQYNTLMKYPLQDLSEIYNNFDSKTSFDLINPKNGYVGLFDSFCYPRYIKLHECILHTINNEIFGKKGEIDYLEKSFKIYQEKNFANELDMYDDHIQNSCGLNCSENECCPLNMYDEAKFKDVNVINIKDKHKDMIKLGLLNTNLDFNDFERRILEKPNLYSKRFDKIKLLINEAIKKDVDLLIMPEMYIPYEWIEKIVEISKNHQIAMVFGVEPVESHNEIGSYIMMTLPFIFEDKYNECAIMYRIKNHYSPYESREFEKYEKKIKGDNDYTSKYYMCIWRGIHIAPYFASEIASIEDRSIFKSCCDIITVSEFNKDTENSNSILEILSKDLFSYCVKSNVAEYGGSTIIQPTNNDKYLVNLKGGQNDYIVTQYLDIKKLRESAIKSDKIINSKNNFSAKPPGFWKNIVKERY